MTILILLLIPLLIEIFFKPRLDFGRGKVFIWYGRKNRTFFIIYEDK